MAEEEEADEKTPLVEKEEDEKTLVVDKADVPMSLQEPGYPKGRKYRLEWISMLFVLAFSWYWFVILAAVISACVDCYLRMEMREILNPIVFKSLFVVFGFLLGFRNVRANNRIEEAGFKTQTFFASAWTVLMLLPDESRPRASKALLFAINEMASYVESVCERKYSWYTIVGLRPNKAVHLGVQGDSSRGLLVQALLMVEELIMKEEAGPDTKRRRFLWPEKIKMLDTFDAILHLTLPAVSDRYASLVDFCLFAFVILLPWGIPAKPIALNGSWGTVSAGTMLVLETIFVTVVLLGLNALAQENEDPFGSYREDFNLRSFVRLFELGLVRYEKRNAQVKHVMNAQVPQGATALETELWYRALMCRDLAPDEKAHGDFMKEQLGLV